MPSEGIRRISRKTGRNVNSEPYAIPNRNPAELGMKYDRERKSRREAVDSRELTFGSVIRSGGSPDRKAMTDAERKSAGNPDRPITHSPSQPPSAVGMKKERPKTPSASPRRSAGATAAM